MGQLPLFDEDLPFEIRKQVVKQFPKMKGEDYDEWLEVIRVEVDYRLEKLRENRPKPHYKEKSSICK